MNRLERGQNKMAYLKANVNNVNIPYTILKIQIIRGCRDGSVDKVLVVLGWGSEFESSNPT